MIRRLSTALKKAERQGRALERRVMPVKTAVEATPS